MWIKDIKKYEIEVYQDENKLYSGISDDVPDELKELEAKEMKLVQSKIIIKI